MRQIVFFILSLFILTSPSVGQKDVVRKIPNALLWKISGNGLSEPSYLYGTIHLINKEDFFLSDSLQAVFSRTDQVAFEIDMKSMSDMSVIMPLMMKAFMNNDTTLADLYSPNDYQIVKSHFEKVGLPLMFLERIKPMFLSALGSEDILTMNTSNELVSYEMELMKMAEAQGKSSLGLETAEYQMSMFDSIPYKIQAQMLLETIQSGDGDNDEFEEMIQLYKNQDINGMQTLMQSEEAGIGNYEALLLTNRNKNWIPIMSKVMNEKSTFFAVGAGHLGGENGVVNLLINAGYTLEPLP